MITLPPMKQHIAFIFEEYDFDPATGKITLEYSLDHQISFIETLTIPLPHPLPTSPSLDRALFSLHLSGGASYYKTCCPKHIEIKSGSLTEEGAKFWNALYENGLGEFFFKNNIDFRGLINFPSLTPTLTLTLPPNEQNSERPQRILVPVGGGKDSLVTIEMLKAQGFEVTLLRMGHHPLIDRIAETAGLPLLTVDRHLSPALFKLNEQGALNGHVPITAYLSFVAIVVAMLHEFDAIVLSNERSANFGNVQYLDREINHQWSKSVAFERMLQAYLQESIGTDIAVFSLLRPMSELGIVQEFAKHPKYFSLATSCNKNWKILRNQSVGFLPEDADGAAKHQSRSNGVLHGGAMHRSEATGAWCGSCPKCAFVFALYAAFIPKATTEKIFGKNLFNDPSLEPLYRELLGLQGFKPFECVGTPDETKAAFLLAHIRDDLEDTVMMTMFIKEVLPTISDPEKLIADSLKFSDDHAIPEVFYSILTAAMEGRSH